MKAKDERRGKEGGAKGAIASGAEGIAGGEFAPKRWPSLKGVGWCGRAVYGTSFYYLALNRVCLNIRKEKQDSEMAKADQTLHEIKEEVRELRVLYKELVDRLIPVGKPTAVERRAIRESGQVATERELMRALGVRHRD